VVFSSIFRGRCGRAVLLMEGQASIFVVDFVVHDGLVRITNKSVGGEWSQGNRRLQRKRKRGVVIEKWIVLSRSHYIFPAQMGGEVCGHCTTLIFACATRPGYRRASLRRSWFRFPGLNDVYPERTSLWLKLVSMHSAKHGRVLALVECGFLWVCCDREIRSSMCDEARGLSIISAA
jgi:hypothetical protein